MSTPTSVINICSGVRLDNRYDHSIWFADAQAQREFFAGKVVKTFSAYSYLRKSWSIKVQASMEQAKTWNYLYFQNGPAGNPGGKVYYYFITNIEYINDNTVELFLDLDVIQTYLFDFDLLSCFVERQHTTTDVIGANTVDEGLELGEPVTNSVIDVPVLKSMAIMILATINPNYADSATPVQALAGNYNGVFSGLKCWAVDGSRWAEWGNKLDDLSKYADGIVAMWMYPKSLIVLGGESTWAQDELCKPVESFVSNGQTFGYDGRPSALDGYAPKNNKLLTYPYQFLYASNNAGASAIYRYERFYDPLRHNFALYGCISPEGNVFMVPCDYNGVERDFDQGLSLGGFPTCAWDSDIYKMWLAQNQNQLNVAGGDAVIKAGAGIIGGIASVAMGNVAGGVAGVATAYSGAKQIADLVAQKKDMQAQPPQARGTHSSSTNITAGKQTFTLYYKSINAEMARIIDDYFTMYGYKLNRVQVPNINARPAFTYVKTIGCKIQGTMCTEDIVRIESIFDRGITFWKNGNKVADYTQSNTP